MLLLFPLSIYIVLPTLCFVALSAKELFCWLCTFQLTCLKYIKLHLFLNTTILSQTNIACDLVSPLLSLPLKQEMTYWCSSDNSKLLKLSRSTPFFSKYISTHSRVENVWVRLDWICTQSFPQNPFTCILTTAFWDVKKDPNWRNEILRHWMKFFDKHKDLSRETCTMLQKCHD